MSKERTEAVREAAAGRWPGILQAVCGMSPETLDGRHGPCPRCGGEDRFRVFDDFEKTGGVICNQCHSEKNGDGFATVAWMLSVTFPTAVKRVADYLGMSTATGGKGAADPAKDLEFQDWSSGLVAHLLLAKPGFTEQSLLDAGARMAKYKKQFAVIALPIIGQDLDCSKPVGWALMNYNGNPLPKWNKDGEVVGQTKVKITYGSKPGLIGRHAIERLKLPGLADVVWKVEGLTDLFTLQAAIPENLKDRHLVVTNANGAGETPRWPAAVLATTNCNVLHDADKPGVDGALTWAKQIAAQSPAGIQVKALELPYEIAEDRGKDLRDFVNEGHKYGDLLAIADSVAAIAVPRTAEGEVDYSKVEYPIQEKILKKLQLEVLYEEENGAIRVFSTLQRKSSTIQQVERLRKEKLIQICGPPAKELVSKDPDGENTWGIEDVREAIALSASNRRGKGDERGVGVWQGIDNYGNENETIVLVGNTEGARWNGDKVLRRIIAPRADGLVLDFGASSTDWYDFESLERYLGQAVEVDWRRKVVDEAVLLFSRWRWRNQEIDPTLITGLILATWVQTVWDWRPLVAISGESNSGKSYLFGALGGTAGQRGIFGALAFKQAKSTAAGIMQGLGNTARVALCDEFEASKERSKILEAFRQSTRGESTAKGTSHHKGVQFVLRHISWVAAIETGLDRQPDANRFVQFELRTADVGKQGQLVLPDGRYLCDLGQKLLAVAVRCAIQAKRMAVLLKDTQVDGVDPRTVESYGVPAAMLAVAEGSEDNIARALLKSLLKNVDRAEQGRIDQVELLNDILTASVNMGGRGVLTVGQILEDPNLRLDHKARLEASGIRQVPRDQNSSLIDLFFAPRLITQHLLRGSAWEGQKIDQILLRLGGVERTTFRLGGRAIRGLKVPAEVTEVKEKNEGF